MESAEESHCLKGLLGKLSHFGMHSYRNTVDGLLLSVKIFKNLRISVHMTSLTCQHMHKAHICISGTYGSNKQASVKAMSKLSI